MGEEDKQVYNEGLKRGGYLLTARVAEGHYDAALDALDTDDAVDLDARSDDWRSEGWDGCPPHACEHDGLFRSRPGVRNCRNGRHPGA